jgi:hypothetical protein
MLSKWRASGRFYRNKLWICELGSRVDPFYQLDT